MTIFWECPVAPPGQPDSLLFVLDLPVPVGDVALSEQGRSLFFMFGVFPSFGAIVPCFVLFVLPTRYVRVLTPLPFVSMDCNTVFVEQLSSCLQCGDIKGFFYPDPTSF